MALLFEGRREAVYTGQVCTLWGGSVYHRVYIKTVIVHFRRLLTILSDSYFPRYSQFEEVRLALRGQESRFYRQT